MGRWWGELGRMAVVGRRTAMEHSSIHPPIPTPRERQHGNHLDMIGERAAKRGME